MKFANAVRHGGTTVGRDRSVYGGEELAGSISCGVAFPTFNGLWNCLLLSNSVVSWDLSICFLKVYLLISSHCLSTTVQFADVLGHQSFLSSCGFSFVGSPSQEFPRWSLKLSPAFCSKTEADRSHVMFKKYPDRSLAVWKMTSTYTTTNPGHWPIFYVNAEYLQFTAMLNLIFYNLE